jgi:hypothetical protein
MGCSQKDGERFRDRAEELRTIADGSIIAENRKMLLKMAEYYERFAREIETSFPET